MTPVIPMPLAHLSEHELQVQAWEQVMAGGFRNAEHQRLVGELGRRTSPCDKFGQRSH